MTFDIRHEFDDGLLEVEAKDLHQWLSGPTIFDLRHHRKRPFFVATLLHGNETTGWDATRHFIEAHPEASFILLVGNPTAAAAGMRHLPHEMDFNRVWLQEPWCSTLRALLADVDPWCGIDIHNNSGPNPHYSVVTNRKAATLSLATLFSNKIIFTDHTLEILGHALSLHCPALTIETGTVDDPRSEERAFNMLHQLNELDEVPDASFDALESFATLGIVKVQHEHADLCTFPQFSTELEDKSFSVLPAGSRFAERLSNGWHLTVSNPANKLDLTCEYFDFRDQGVYLKQDVVLSMFTRKPLLALQDCVCYFLASVNLTDG